MANIFLMGNIFSDGRYFWGIRIWKLFFSGTGNIDIPEMYIYKCDRPPVPVAGAAAGAAAGHAVGVLVAAAEPHQPVPRVVQDQRPAA